MPESNYAALTQGLKLYTDAMRRFIKERLIAKYPNNWWEHGVLGSFDEKQRDALKRDEAKAKGKERLELLDPNHIVRIVTRQFDSAFAGVFGDFRQTQSYLNLVAAARNDWAHPRTGDLLAEDVSNALYAMQQVLGTAKLPEAAQVEALRQAVLGIAVSPTLAPAPAPAAPAKPARASRKGALPYWWEVCEPHDGFKNPTAIDEGLFAATLGGVYAGAARDEYKKPELFLAHTYFTENLKQTVHDVVSRLNNGQGPSVTEMQTPFGGGKTHALLTLYHLISNPKVAMSVPGVKEALGDLKIPPKARVLVFDGQERSAEPTITREGGSFSTMWGELTYQVDIGLFTKLMMDADSRGEAPGNAVFRQVLEKAAPCLILIDELVSYLVKVRFSSGRRNQNLYRQTVQFVQETLQLAGNVPGVCVILSLPKSIPEFGGLKPEELKRELAVLEELRPRADRVVSKRTPINDEEIYLLMSKRLFKKMDREAAERVAGAYRELYRKTESLYDRTVFSSDFLQQQIAAYPLHPELIDVLYKKWSTASDFPRTRAVLQLLASIVADQWVARQEAYTIQSAHVSLERERIRTRIVSAAGSGGGYDSVVAADIIGGDAHADMQDERRGGAYARLHITRGTATTLLMHSFGGQTRPGATPAELRLGTVAPNVGLEYVSEVLATLEESLWYVHRQGELLQFQVKVNVYRMIAETAKGQPPATVIERLRAELANAQGAADGFLVLPWAGADGSIPDRPDPSIAILNPKYAVAQAERNGEVMDRKPIELLWAKVGAGRREWGNALVLVAPDQELWTKAEEAVREVMAYETVIASAEKKSMELSQLEVKELQSKLRDKNDSLRTSLVTAYRWLFYPDENGLTVISLPVPATSNERIAVRVEKRLSAQEYSNPKVLRNIGAAYFNAKIAPRVWKDAGAPLELGELSRRFPQWTYLPILPHRERTLRACIREGIGQRLWAVAVGDSASGKYQLLVEQTEDLDKVAALFDGSASLVKGDYLQLVREQVGASAAKGKGAMTTAVIAQSEPGSAVHGKPPAPIPAPVKRHTRVTIRIEDLRIAKTGFLQAYLFKVLQEQDAGTELTVSIEVNAGAGIPSDVLDKRIAEGLDQLGIKMSWESS